MHKWKQTTTMFSEDWTVRDKTLYKYVSQISTKQEKWYITLAHVICSEILLWALSSRT